MKGNGRGDVFEAMLEELKRVRQELTTTRIELRAEVASVRVELKTEIAALRQDVNNRLDHLVFNIGGHYRDLERRVAALEAARR